MSEFKFKENGLSDAEKAKLHNDFLLEHYKRCKDFYLSYNTSIWSVPSIAATINVVTYYALFDESKNFAPGITPAVLFVLLILNVALCFGLYKHSSFQRSFGGRIIEIERQNNITVIPLKMHPKAANIYVGVMILIIAVNSIIFFIKLVHAFCP